MRKKTEFEIQLKDLEKSLDRLRSLYEQWFQGIERVPPSRQHERFDRQLRELRRNQPRNTALRFRFQTLFQRYTVLKTHWSRIARQIEEGTYRRVLQRAQRRRTPRKERIELAKNAIEVDIDLDSIDFDAEIASALDAISTTSTPEQSSTSTSSDSAKKTNAAKVSATFGRPKDERKRPPLQSIQKHDQKEEKKTAIRSQAAPTASRTKMAPKGPPPPPKPISGARSSPKPPPPPRVRASKPKKKEPVRSKTSEAVGEREMRAIYDRYIQARKQNNERTDNVKFDTLRKQISKMVPKLREKHKGKKIDFEVVVKNGRVGLKPTTKD